MDCNLSRQDGGALLQRGTGQQAQGRATCTTFPAALRACIGYCRERSTGSTCWVDDGRQVDRNRQPKRRAEAACAARPGGAVIPIESRFLVFRVPLLDGF